MGLFDKRDKLDEDEEPRSLGWGVTIRGVCDELGLAVPSELDKVADDSLPGIASSSMTTRPGYLYFVRGTSDKVRSDAVRAWEQKGACAFVTPRPLADSRGNALPCIICKRPTAGILTHMSALRDRTQAKVVALTGSVGKTSTKEMVRLVLQQGFETQCSRGNRNGFSQVLASLQGVLPDTQVLVQEVGMGKPGSVERAAKVLRPDYFIVTNIGLNHVEYYGGKQEGILAEKLNLDKQAAPGAVGFVNWDDPMLRGAEYRHRVVTFAVERDDADFCARDVREQNGRVLFDVVERATGETVPVVLNILGRHNVYNALAAFALGREMGMGVDAVCAGIARFHATGVRQNLTWIAGHHVYLDCYNASEVAISSAAETLESVEVPAGAKRIYVVGDIDDKLGDVTEEVHRRVGRALAARQGIALVVFFGEHMRWAAEEAEAAGKPVLWTADRAELERLVRANLCEGDLIGFKGGQQMQLPLTVDNLFGTDYYLLDGDMTAKVADPIKEVDGIRYRTLHGYGTEIRRFRGLRFTRAGKGLIGRAMRSKLTGFELRPLAELGGEPVRVVLREAFLGSKLTAIRLPDTVRCIGDRAFAGCRKLERLVLPASLRVIGAEAFSGCTSIQELVLPEGVNTVREEAFAGCSALERVELPATLKTIDPTAFEGCPMLRVLCPHDSYASAFCQTHGIPFEER